MFKRVFLYHWIDWTIAIIIMVFLVVWGAVQKYSIEQEYSFTGGDISYSIKPQAKHKFSQDNKSSQEVKEVTDWDAYNNGTTESISSTWKTYTSSEGFNLEYISNQNHPIIPPGMLEFSYPSEWVLNINKNNFFDEECFLWTGVVLTKNDPDYPDIQDLGSTPNSASISFYLKNTNKSPDELVSNYYDNFCSGDVNDIKVFGKSFHGNKAAYLIRDHPTIPYAIVFSISPTAVMLIDIEYSAVFSYGKDYNVEYDKKTLDEIKGIMKSIKIL